MSFSQMEQCITAASRRQPEMLSLLPLPLYLSISHAATHTGVSRAIKYTHSVRQWISFFPIVFLTVCLVHRLLFLIRVPLVRFISIPGIRSMLGQHHTFKLVYDPRTCHSPGRIADPHIHAYAHVHTYIVHHRAITEINLRVSWLMDSKVSVFLLYVRILQKIISSRVLKFMRRESTVSSSVRIAALNGAVCLMA